LILAEIADHPEITLSRREILRFILVEPTTRSDEIQTILKLDEIGKTRSAFNTAQNKLQTVHKTSTALVQSHREALQLHLQIATVRAEEILLSSNQRRKVLGISTIAELTADTKLDSGISATIIPSAFNKESALRDIAHLSNAANDFKTLAAPEADAVVASLGILEADSDLLAALAAPLLCREGAKPD
jgi:cellobiose-specific phosphotransferase system component IIA